MTWRALWLLALPFAAAICALGTLHAAAPLYLVHQGFPLDDAWIHAVYARELARSGMLAYNPGVPATGETAPLWAAILAVVHTLTADPASAVALTKVLGFTLHVASAALLGLALCHAPGGSRVLAWAAAALVACHQDLVASSVSGMEVPLATLVVGGALLATLRHAHLGLSLVGAFAVGARPETAVLAVGVPLLFHARSRPAAAARLSGSAACGALLALGLLGLRNYSVSGMALPATFHAKVRVASAADLLAQVQNGFHGLLGQFPVVGSSIVLAAALALSLVILSRSTTGPIGRAAAAMYASGVAYAVTSFVLVSPVDPAAFYHQRYVLPALFAMLAALPLLAYDLLASLPRRAFVLTYGAAAVVSIGLMLQSSPSRYRRLSNDARNIDDVQVAFGRALGMAGISENAWVVDAGASRFFGKPFVVDLLGLNTPEVLGSNAQTFLDEHPPRYLDLFPGWSRIESNAASMPVRRFETQTPYTVTSSQPMRQHLLVSCEPAGTQGRVIVRGRPFTFRCGT